jgi:hypothetical protein
MKPNPLSLTSRLIVPFMGAIAISSKSIESECAPAGHDCLGMPNACPKTGRRWMNAGWFT